MKRPSHQFVNMHLMLCAALVAASGHNTTRQCHAWLSRQRSFKQNWLRDSAHRRPRRAPPNHVGLSAPVSVKHDPRAEPRAYANLSMASMPAMAPNGLHGHINANAAAAAARMPTMSKEKIQHLIQVCFVLQLRPENSSSSARRCSSSSGAYSRDVCRAQPDSKFRRKHPKCKGYAGYVVRADAREALSYRMNSPS